MKIQGKKANEVWKEFFETNRLYCLVKLGVEAADFFDKATLEFADVLHPSRKSKGDKDHQLQFTLGEKEYTFEKARGNFLPCMIYETDTKREISPNDLLSVYDMMTLNDFIDMFIISFTFSEK